MCRRVRAKNSFLSTMAAGIAMPCIETGCTWGVAVRRPSAVPPGGVGVEVPKTGTRAPSLESATRLNSGCAITATPATAARRRAACPSGSVADLGLEAAAGGDVLVGQDDRQGDGGDVGTSSGTCGRAFREGMEWARRGRSSAHPWAARPREQPGVMSA
jgi:hypothetical protein